ncbi:DUF6519 domain-containing protein [Streptomyces sp. NBC_01207]|uniref:DUF6519 domain-containing protein n=1 Tax=Streptomyces sp. NBC_01207 TaxID=2903772 RepID=UPI002E11FF62|nr:DUF4815 domain-containing protein [Streptomyces sp. NBC_01207]
MAVDISRVSFDPSKHYSQLIHQQGRVTLDADANEQAAVLLHYLRTVVADLLGPAACPEAAPGFSVTLVEKAPDRDFEIGPGRLYVDGLLVENDHPTTYLSQPEGFVDPDAAAVPVGPFIAYLRAWEREITAIQDPSIREIALGSAGPDTAARAKVVWQVALYGFGDEDPGSEGAAAALRAWLDGLHRPPGLMAAQARHDGTRPTEACTISPQARFRGPENQLYRVQIHTSGVGVAAGYGETALQAVPAARQKTSAKGKPTGPDVATFVWSRENASVAVPVVSVAGPVVTVAAWGRDSRLGLDVGDLVELVDDATAVHAADDVASAPPQGIHRIVAVDVPGRTVTLDADPHSAPGWGPPPLTVSGDPELHPYLRRWDHRPPRESQPLPVVLDTWIPLEDGVEVRFAGRLDPVPNPKKGGKPGRFRRGDHWLVPARTIPGDVLWPQDEHGPAPVPPHGVAYRYAPLAYVPTQGDPVSLVPHFKPLFP